METKELRAKLIRLSELKAQIDNDVRAIYEEYGKLTAECADEILIRKGGNQLGVPKVNLPLRFKDGRTWVLKPLFIKDGQFTNLIWKHMPIPAFSVEEVTPVNPLK
jgi:hypothetical protein